MYGETGEAPNCIWARCEVGPPLVKHVVGIDQLKTISEELQAELMDIMAERVIWQNPYLFRCTKLLESCQYKSAKVTDSTKLYQSPALITLPDRYTENLPESVVTYCCG